MAFSAVKVLRVKRLLEAEPSEALILNCKKPKLSENTSNNEFHTLLQLAGTTKTQDEDISHLLNRPAKIQLEEEFKKHNTNITEKLREQTKQNSKKNRYKVVNCFRTKAAENGDSTLSDITIYDIETEHSEDVTHDADPNLSYVYDLYYTESDDLGDNISDYVNLYQFSEELIFGSMADNGYKQRDSEDDSEDSNAECNWRNDYPDESDLDSVNEEDMLEAIEKLDIKDETLSSDEADDDFVYSADSETANNHREQYGSKYAKFKAKHTAVIESSTLEKDLYCGDIDEEEYYY